MTHCWIITMTTRATWTRLSPPLGATAGSRLRAGHRAYCHGRNATTRIHQPHHNTPWNNANPARSESAARPRNNV